MMQHIEFHGLMQSVTGCKVHHLEVALSFSHCCQVQKNIAGLNKGSVRVANLPRPVG